MSQRVHHDGDVASVVQEAEAGPGAWIGLGVLGDLQVADVGELLAGDAGPCAGILIDDENTPVEDRHILAEDPLVEKTDDLRAGPAALGEAHLSILAAWSQEPVNEAWCGLDVAHPEELQR